MSPSILIVLVGSIFVVLMQYPLAKFLSAGKVAAKAFMFKSIPLDTLIDEIYGLADEARKGGLLSLEGKEVSHPFLSKGIQMLVDGHDGTRGEEPVVPRYESVLLSSHLWRQGIQGFW